MTGPSQRPLREMEEEEGQEEEEEKEKKAKGGKRRGGGERKERKERVISVEDHWTGRGLIERVMMNPTAEFSSYSRISL